MKQILIALALIVFVAPLFAGNFAEVQVSVAPDGKAAPQFNIWIQKPVGHGFSVFGWGIGSQAWSEGLVGLDYAPTKWLEVNAGLGLEEAKNNHRASASVWVGGNKADAIILWENGGSGSWHKAVVGYQATKRLKVGAMTVAGVGTGPRMDVSISPKLVVWAAALHKNGETSVQVTAHRSF